MTLLKADLIEIYLADMPSLQFIVGQKGITAISYSPDAMYCLITQDEPTKRHMEYVGIPYSVVNFIETA